MTTVCAGRRLGSLLAAALVVVAGATGVAAQTEPPATDPPTTSTTEPTTTTTSGLPFPGETTTTTVDAPEQTTTTAPDPTGTDPSGVEPGGDGEPPPGTPRSVPPDAQRVIDNVTRSRANSTTGLIDALRPLEAEGFTPTEAAVIGFGAFPVAGPTTFVHDWYFPRYTPTFHLHQGTDLFAPHGTPVRAPFDGVLRRSEGPVGGLAAYVTAADGTYAYLAHLSAFFPGQDSGAVVRRGDVVGFVGSSGNAVGSPPHVHIQLHPRGGGPADPKATLDSWIADATAQAPALIARIRAERRPGPSAGPAGPVDSIADDPGGVVPGGGEGHLDHGTAGVWLAAANPSAGTLDLAAATVAAALDDFAARPAGPGSGPGAVPAALALDVLFPAAFASV